MATALLGGALLLAACGSSDDVATKGSGQAPGQGSGPRPGPTDGASDTLVAPEGTNALDCSSGLASGLTFDEAPPSPGETRDAATVVADALRAKGVVPEAAQAVESLGGGLERRWALRPGRASELADDLGREADVGVTATVDAAEPGTPAEVAVSRDDRVVVIVSVSEQQPGYWGLDQLWACAEEVAVTEYRE